MIKFVLDIGSVPGPCKLDCLTQNLKLIATLGHPDSGGETDSHTEHQRGWNSSWCPTGQPRPHGPRAGPHPEGVGSDVLAQPEDRAQHQQGEDVSHEQPRQRIR